MDIETAKSARDILKSIRGLESKLTELDEDCKKLDGRDDWYALFTYGSTQVTVHDVKKIASYQKEVLTNRKKEYEKILKNL